MYIISCKNSLRIFIFKGLFIKIRSPLIETSLFSVFYIQMLMYNITLSNEGYYNWIFIEWKNNSEPGCSQRG